MSITDRLAAAGEDVLKKKGPEFYDGLLSDGTSLAEEHVPEELRGHALDGLEILRDEKVKGAALNLAGHGFARIVNAFAENDEELAKREYMATQASTQERIDFQNSAGDEAVLLFEKRQREWEALEEAFKRIGKLALKGLAALLTGALGL